MFVAPFIMAVAASVVSLRRKRTGLEVASGFNRVRHRRKLGHCSI